MDEIKYISWIQKYLKKSSEIIIHSGDDCAVIKFNDKKNKYLLITSDAIVDGTHFNSKIHSPRQIGRKAVAVSLSDIAAMGCAPDYIVATVVFPHSYKYTNAKAIFRGMEKIADEYNVKIIGGDIVLSSYSTLSITTTVFSISSLTPISRSNTCVGDSIIVTGPLGGSILKKQFYFTPRIKEGITLNKNLTIHSMIDISDGLIMDLYRILLYTHSGALLYEDKIPISADAFKISQKTKKKPLYHALYDGEDFELLFTLPPNELKTLKKLKKLKYHLIGTVIPQNKILLLNSTGKISKLPVKGYLHEFSH